MLQGQKSDEDLFIGDIIVNAKPIRRRSSKYYVPEFVYGGGLYPSYAGGGGFVMSGHTARRLSSACQQVLNINNQRLKPFFCLIFLWKLLINDFVYTSRWSCSPLMMSFWECASRWSVSNHSATRVFGPLEFPDHLQHPTFRRSTLVSTGNSWSFTASACLKFGSCGTFCMTPNWAVTTGQAQRPGPSGGGGRRERR